MFQAKYIQKFRNKNNQIIGYRLQDSNGYTKDVTSDQLKQAIKNHQITIINLTLTSDNRLIDTTTPQSQQKQQPKISEEQKIKDMILKAKTLGLPVKEIPTYCKHKCYRLSQSPTQHLVYIPDDVTRLNINSENLFFTDYIKQLQGTLKVVGGKNLTDAAGIFYGCKAQSLDLSNFDTSKVKTMHEMFRECQAQSLDLSTFNTSNVTDMEFMFGECQAHSIDLSNFNTSKVTDMCGMFFDCQAQSLDLSSFDTSKVTDMEYMFKFCQAQSLDLHSFNTSKVMNMCEMFKHCHVQFLDLSSFDTSNVEDMSEMFCGCRA